MAEWKTNRKKRNLFRENGQASVKLREEERMKVSCE